VADCASLTADSAARYSNENIIFADVLSSFKGLGDDEFEGFQTAKVVVNIPFIDGDLPIPWQ
jgi:hypothetical protein